LTRREAHVSGKLEEFERLCREQGLPVTVQRRTVLEALAGREDHPTADQVFDEVCTRIPGIARGSVYRILETLVKLGIVRKVCHPGAASRFETKTHRHHHLVCLQCGKMIDLEDSSLDRIALPDARSRGFELVEYSIQFRGTCSACSRKASQESRRRRHG
jgi:Fur family peroxide stress response transcriptional regulator